jgi:hypothetical protein
VALASPTSAEPTGWAETFREGWLDPARWEVTAEGDFRDRDVDVLDVKKRGVGDFRLRLRADTRGARDGTVKVLGVRGARKIPLGEATRISAELDWNEQANGSYLSAALVLAPTATSMNPLTSLDWVKVEYVGVPPGQNARLVVGVKVEGRERTVYAEGWPDTNRAGRNIALQQVMIAVRDRAFQVCENGQLVYDSGGTPSPLTRPTSTFSYQVTVITPPGRFTSTTSESQTEIEAGAWHFSVSPPRRRPLSR